MNLINETNFKSKYLKSKTINKKRKKIKIKHKKKYSIFIYILFLFILIILFSFVSFFIYKKLFKKAFIKVFTKVSSYPQDDLTLVSTYYELNKSKHNFRKYLSWVSNIAKLNKSMVFFTNNKFMSIFKKMRPKNLYYKTVFIELEFEDFIHIKIYIKNLIKLTNLILNIKYILFHYI